MTPIAGTTAGQIKGFIEQDGTPPQVVQSAYSPTGYYVTFQYHAPDAERVRIFGEWYFSDLPHASVASGANIQPQNYQKGYTVLGPNGWDYQDMTLDPAAGIWSITLPLPGGTWNYFFYVGGAKEDDVRDVKNAWGVYDPSNLPILYDYANANMSGETFLHCQVYVPYDSRYQIDLFDDPEQKPRDGERGEFFYRDVIDDAGNKCPFGIYLPYGFDANRAEKYPVLVMIHGKATVWANEGALRPIMDNMIAEGRIEPTIVITPGGTMFRDATGKRGSDMPAMMDAIINHMLPYVAENYNGTTDPDRRAIGGLSRAGAWTLYAYFNRTLDFKYYLAMSPNTSDSEPNYTKPELMTRTIIVNMSAFDDPKSFNVYYSEKDENGNFVPLPYGPSMGNSGNCYELIYELVNAKIPFVLYGENLLLGHQWAFWRKALVYDLENILWK
jgi:enterochelin esterase-like enzyme